MPVQISGRNGVGIDRHTVALLRCNGADGSTVFPDISLVGNVFTAQGNACVRTNESRFGGGSAFFDGTGDYLSCPRSSVFDIGYADFTIDLWYRPESVDSGGIWGLVSALNDSGMAAWGLVWYYGQTYFFGDTAGTGSVGAANFTLNAWHHIAYCRRDGLMYAFVNGVRKVNGAAFNKNLICGSGGVAIGAFYNSGASTFQGGMHQIRITKGLCRWTSSFTVPNREY